MALTTYHHGITRTESSNITPIIQSISMSTIALVTTSADADDTAYPIDTPVLLSGITTADLDKAGAKESLLYKNLRTIKAIQNTSVVVLRVADPVDVDKLDILLTCQTRLGVKPKLFAAPEIDTPAIARKLAELAAKNLGFAYASPRRDDGTLITVKEDIVAYRKTFSAREITIIEGGFGNPVSTLDSESDTATLFPLNFLKFNNDIVLKNTAQETHALVYSINDNYPQQLTPHSTSSTATLNFFLAGIDGEIEWSFMSYGDNDLSNWSPANMPNELENDSVYLFGLNAEYLQLATAIKQGEVPDGITVSDVSVTFYPASVIDAYPDVDIFDLIIDPSTYTAAEIDYFASHGISPAVKNADGSYTVKSKLHIAASGTGSVGIGNV